MRKITLILIIIAMVFSSVVFAEVAKISTLADFLELSNENITSITMHRVPYSDFETRTTNSRQQIEKFINIAKNITISMAQDSSVGGGSGDLYIEVLKNDGVSYARIGNDGGIDSYSLFMNRKPSNLYRLDDNNITNDLWFSIDKNISDWAQKEVNTAWLFGLIPQGQFYNYTQNITREQFCDVAANVLNLANKAQSDSTYNCPFEDTDSKNVALLWNSKIINGKSETEFAPNTLLTREEAVSILRRMYSVMGLTKIIDEYSYTDYEDISDWAKADANAMRSAGIMKGVRNNFFEPKANFTIEQAIATMLRLFNQYSKSVTTLKFVDEAGNLILSSDDLVKCDVRKSSISENYEVMVHFTSSGINKFSVATGWISLYGSDNCITILNNNEIISKPRVVEKITADSVAISGQFSLEQAIQLKDLIKKQITVNNTVDLSKVSFKMKIQDARLNRDFGMYGELKNESAIFLRGNVERGRIQENSKMIFVDENGKVLYNDTVFKIEIIELSSPTAFKSRRQSFAENGDDIVIYLKAGDFYDDVQYSQSVKNLELIRKSQFAVLE